MDIYDFGLEEVESEADSLELEEEEPEDIEAVLGVPRDHSNAAAATPPDSPDWNDTSSASDMSSLSLESCSGGSADSPRAVRARNEENRQNCGPSITELLLKREYFGRDLKRSGLCTSSTKHLWGVRKQARLVDLVDDRKKMLREGHIFLGFTQDGRYLLSYTSSAPRTWMYPLGVGMFPEESHGGFKLHFWRFSPFPKKTKIVHTVKLFRKHSRFPTTVKIVVSQWPDDDERVMIVAYWDESEGHYRGTEGAVDRNIAISIIPIPTNPSSSTIPIPRPEIHTDLWLTETPHPVFHPEYCMVVPGLLMFHGGGLLIFYRYLHGSIPSIRSRRVSNPCARPELKRKYPDDDLQTPETFRVDRVDLDIEEALMREIFYQDNSAHLIDASGILLRSHPLQASFQNNGRPVFFGNPIKDENCLVCDTDTMEVWTFRVDIVLEKAWEHFQKRIGGAVICRKVFTSETDSVDPIKEELLLKACYFVTLALPRSENGKNGSRLRQVMFPIFVRINYRTGKCSAEYWGNKTEDADKPWQYSEEYLHKMMNKLTSEVRHKIPKYVLRDVHALNNHSVERNISMDSLLTPDGCIKVTL